MKEVYFVTGTDTEIGKTYTSCHLLKQKHQQGYKTLGLKPLSSGGILPNQMNEDAWKLSCAASEKHSSEQINPFSFDQAIAPHIASQQQGLSVTALDIANKCQQLIDHSSANYILIEGAGGWLVPINQKESWRDVVMLLKIPVIIVVGMRLGCINHGLLTYRQIKHDTGADVSWIANTLSNRMPYLEQNIDTLSDWIGRKPMAVI